MHNHSVPEVSENRKNALVVYSQLMAQRKKVKYARQL